MVDAINTASVRGTYALTLSGEGGSAPLAGIGFIRFDGAGRLSGFWRESRPGAEYGERVLAEVAYETGYGVTANGTGALTTPGAEEPDGYLAIRSVTRLGGIAFADELALVFRTLDSATGALRTATAVRLPDNASFNAASLRGRYLGFAVGRGGQFPVAGFGAVVYDGEGGFSEENVANVQGESFRDRRFVANADRGTYTVDSDGTGTVADGGVLLMITRARLLGDRTIADAYSFIVRDLAPVNGAQFTGTVKRLGD